ncbi:GNAT family N-acetyltransferase [Pacificoceanicola onchidii]|uniref:GNAT family N-acetyltransferase n=1 Tax=Pacificoceanicola onchidii TaxID=2562685 RepID=UPI0010A6A5C6|nr:GNAT family N-acetyltransferase [Pacificoceanicola onchidii]
MSITIRPLPLSELHLTQGFNLPPDQAGFADMPMVSMRNPDGRDGHLIEYNGGPAGFFAIDRHYGAEQTYAPEGVIGLRMFLIDHAQQGKGVASGACRLLKTYLPQHYDAPECWLTVNERNPGARKAYLNGGFVDTGEMYLDGGFGPQHILRLPLR